MAVKKDVAVRIDGKDYTFSGYESEEYLNRLSNFINKRIEDCKGSNGFRRLPSDVQHIMIHLNIADDYFKAKKQADMLESEVESKDKEIYDLKHELISQQISLDSQNDEIKRMKETIDNYQKRIFKLESDLEEFLKN